MTYEVFGCCVFGFFVVSFLLAFWFHVPPINELQGFDLQKISFFMVVFFSFDQVLGSSMLIMLSSKHPHNTSMCTLGPLSGHQNRLDPPNERCVPQRTCILLN
ncbi:hypothetical protein Dimus_037369 [Dionaea muscipula]